MSSGGADRITSSQHLVASSSRPVQVALPVGMLPFAAMLPDNVADFSKIKNCECLCLKHNILHVFVFVLVLQYF